MIITIDGPTASGKSSVAQALAKKLSAYYLNTGLLYRAVAYVLSAKNTDFSEADLSFIDELSYDYYQGAPRLMLGDRDITEHLYNSGLDQPASLVSAHPLVREKLLPVQRAITEKYDIVADGRDCGSVVFPNADYKFFLTADVTTRAQRMMADPKRKINFDDLESAKCSLEERDKRDRERAVAPLIVPEGAIIIDNSHMTFDETVTAFLGYVAR